MIKLSTLKLMSIGCKFYQEVFKTTSNHTDSKKMSILCNFSLELYANHRDRNNRSTISVLLAKAAKTEIRI
jgi:hypothetical protein